MKSFLLMVTLATSCVTSPPQPPTPTPTPVVEEPTKPVVLPFTCATACDNLKRLDCEDSKDTPEGATCEEICENARTGSIVALRWDVEQLTTADTCEE